MTWLILLQEGIISAAIGVVAAIILIDFPDRGKPVPNVGKLGLISELATRPGLFLKKGFLTPEEAAIILARVERDRADAVPEPFTMRNILRALSDWKMWQFPFLLFCNVSSGSKDRLEH